MTKARSAPKSPMGPQGPAGNFIGDAKDLSPTFVQVFLIRKRRHTDIDRHALDERRAR